MIPSGVPPMPRSMSTPLSGRAAAIAPATSPSEMNWMRAPASADVLDELLVPRTVEHARP